MGVGLALFALGLVVLSAFCTEVYTKLFKWLKMKKLPCL